MHTSGRNPNYWMVDVHSKKGYQTAKLYLTPDGKSGVAITKDGNITSLFNGSNERGRLAKLLTFAVASGGRKLDCFAGGLQNMYARYGAKAIAQTPFDWRYAPKGATEAHPVVAMMLPKTVGGVISAYKRNAARGGTSVAMNRVPEYPDYDSMIAARDEALARRDGMSVANMLRTALGGSN